MADVVGRTVTDFKSLEYGQFNTGNRAYETRRRLDTPNELLNMLHTDTGALWMPPARETMISSVPGTGDILLVVNGTIDDDAWIMTQRGTTVSLWRSADFTVPFAATTDTHTLSSDQKCWVNSSEDTIYFGNSTDTVKASYNSGAGSWTFTDLSSSVPNGYHSMAYRSRRFVMQRSREPGQQRRLWYSEIGDYEAFGSNSFISISGSVEGDSWENSLGSPVAVQPFGEVLLLFQTQGIQRFTGTDPLTDFTIRTTGAQTGLWLRDTVSYIEPGLIYFGGTPRGEFGFYLFRGSSSELLSRSLNGYLRRWVENNDQTFNEDLGEAAVWRNNYICALDVESGSVADADPTIYLYNWIDGKWATFNGYTRPTVALARPDPTGGDVLAIADSDQGAVSYTSAPMARAAVATPASFKVGYEDEEQPSGLARYLHVRLTVDAIATGGTGIDFDLTATTASGASVTAATQTITTDGQHTLLFPLRLRGNSIELAFTITPSATAHEAAVVNLELVQSRKRLKVARIGGE